MAVPVLLLTCVSVLLIILSQLFRFVILVKPLRNNLPFIRNGILSDAFPYECLDLCKLAVYFRDQVAG